MKIKVYLNRTRKCLSLQHKNKVIGYANYVKLKNANFIVNQAGRKRALKTSIRCVHAWIEGEPIYIVNWIPRHNYEKPPLLPDKPLIYPKFARYVPVFDETFIDTSTLQPIAQAKFVTIHKNGVVRYSQ